MPFWKKGSGEKSAGVPGWPHAQPWAAITRFLAWLSPPGSWEKELSLSPTPTEIFPCLQKEWAGKGKAQPESRCVWWLWVCWQRTWERFHVA